MNKVIKVLLTLFYLSVQFAALKSQTIVPPYTSGFDNAADTAGWIHYALSGTDDWQLGVPNDYYLSEARSTPNAWVTNLNTSYAGSSNRALESPLFDLSDTTVNLSLSFYQQRQDNTSGIYYYLEYSLNNGSTWQLLNLPSVQKYNWQTANGFEGIYYTSYQFSSTSLLPIQGEDSVKFRFRCSSGTVDGEGWMIDDFRIGQENYNYKAYRGDTSYTTRSCETFAIRSKLGFDNEFGQYILNTTNYYFSYDTVLDPSDSLIGSRTYFNNAPANSYGYTLNQVPGLSVGYYYVFYVHDALDTLVEIDENDNISYAVLKVDSIFETPHVEDFENAFEFWKTNDDVNFSAPTAWLQGEGYRHHLEKAHSGNTAWHTSRTFDYDYSNCNGTCEELHLYSNTYDLSTDTGTMVLNLWFKDHRENTLFKVDVNSNCGSYFNLLSNLPVARDDDWDFVNIDLSSISDSSNVRFRIQSASSYLHPEGLIIDDVYIGTAKPDLSIERAGQNLFSSSNLSSDSISYFLNNSGLFASDPTITSFYWSNDAFLDPGDIFIGSKTESAMAPGERRWETFQISKVHQNPGEIYIFYVLDSAQLVDEMREGNNIGYFILNQMNPTIIPYENDFESQVNGWSHESSLGNDDWQWTTPKGDSLHSAFSGSKVWITNDTGLVSAMSRMHLYTPVFSFANDSNPVLEFDMKLNSHPSCHCFEGKMNMTYSIDGGANWLLLDTTNQSFNRWYYPQEYSSNGVDRDYYQPNYTELLLDYSERAFTAVNQYNSRDVIRNTRYVLDLGFLAGQGAVQFRYNLATLQNDNTSPNYPVEGALIDNFGIREAFIDLLIDHRRHLMLSSEAEELRVYIQVKNDGNYLSNETDVAFYLSSDTILDSTDLKLGTDTIASIRPDFYGYLNTRFPIDSSLDMYSYLLFNVDELDFNSEPDEINNLTYWPLDLDSVKSYPYINAFDDSIVHGWHHYSIGPYGPGLGNHRFRNILAPAEIYYQMDLRSGEYFIDQPSSNSSSQIPFYYLESPAFDFSKSDSIYLSFDLMCTGRQTGSSDGGNMDYSIDGGNTWSLLNPVNGPSENWYNKVALSKLGNQAGWSFQPVNINTAQLDSTGVNVSFLRGENGVMFRFKYKSNYRYYGGGTVQGMRIDNFNLSAKNADYKALDSNVLVFAGFAQNQLNVNYSFKNNGETNGRSTETAFYWSADSLFDSTDVLIDSIPESQLSVGMTRVNSLTFNIPRPITQLKYWLFYIIDADSNIIEVKEENNVGSFEILFDSICSVYVDSQYVTSCNDYYWSANNTLYYTDTIDSIWLEDQYACDYLAILTLTINNSDTVLDSLTACDSLTWTVNNQLYTNSGYYSSIYTNSNGCDSTMALQLKINSSDYVQLNERSCYQYTWPANNQTYDSSGLFSVTLTNTFGCDSVIDLNLIIEDTITTSTAETTCFNYQWVANDSVYISSGVYYEYFPSQYGCDSISILNLIINNVDTGISVNGNTLTSNANNAKYQWMICDSTPEILLNDTLSSYTALTNASYAVIVSENNCVDTSECVEISGIGIEENTFGQNITLYPNPTSGDIQIKFTNSMENLLVTQRDEKGSIVNQKRGNANPVLEFEVIGVKGLYHIEIQSPDGNAHFRVLKK